MNLDNHWRKCFDYRFLSGEDIKYDLGGEVVVTIREIKEEELQDSNAKGTDKTVTKTVLYFEKAKKGLVLNKVNAQMIASLHGPILKDWIGKRIKLVSTQVKAWGKTLEAIRVKKA